MKLIFPSLTHLWQIYTIRLTSTTNDIPLMHFHVPWSNEDLYNLVTLRNPSSPSTVLSKSLHRPMRLKLHRPSPKDQMNRFPSLELYLNSHGSYTIQIDSSFLELLAQLIRYYIFLLPTFLFTVLCVSFSLQIYDIRLRVYQTMFAWQIHLPFAVALTVLYRLLVICCPQSTFVVNLVDNGYYFLCLPLILYAVALTLWTLIALIVDNILFDLIRRILFPLFTQLQNELNYRVKYTRYIQCILLLIPLISTLMFSGSNGHITLFFLAVAHTIWRGTINHRLREILTTLLFFHGLLLLLNLTGFIIYVRSVVLQGFLPLYLIMSDSSFLSAVCSIFAFYSRFLFDRSSSKSIKWLKLMTDRYGRMISMSVAIVSHIYCSYSMHYLWIGICVIFVEATLLFFVRIHQE